MSHKALSWAWDLTGLPVTQKFLLVALADFADEEHSCFPGQERLAAMVGVQRQAVSKNLGELEQAGLIKRSRRARSDGSRSSDRFVLAVGQCLQSVRTPERGSMSAKQGGMNNQRTTSIKPSIVSLPSAADAIAGVVVLPTDSQLDDAFSAFWSCYPRRVGRPVASKAFDKAVKRAGGTTPILEGARRLRDDPNLPTGSERNFIPHPSTWLNRDGWEDEPLPPRGGSSSASWSAAAAVDQMLAGSSSQAAITGGM